MWLFASGAFATNPGIRLFHYAPTRSGQVAVDVLGKYNGFVQTDDFAGYNKLTQVDRCLCWAHVRRKFVEAAETASAGTDKTLAEQGIQFIGDLFQKEAALRDMTPEDRK